MERELLIKYLQGDATDHEKTEMVAWLETDQAKFTSNDLGHFCRRCGEMLLWT